MSRARRPRWPARRTGRRSPPCGTAVFVEEQGVPPEIEQDDADATAVHALSRDDAGRVVATGRLLLDAAGPGRR